MKLFELKRLFFASACVLMVHALSVDATAQRPPVNVGYRAVVDAADLPQITFRPSAGNGDDTARLQRVIDNASARRSGPRSARRRGARVFMTNGRYRIRGVQLKSDVYLRFGARVTIDQATGSGRTVSMFVLSDDISNVSIAGQSPTSRVRLNGPAFDPDTRSVTSFRAFSLTGVSNFEIRNVIANNRFSRFSTIIMSVAGQDIDGSRPVGGTVRNYRAIQANGGFGAVQMHAASRVRFDNIQSDGGITLRFESDIENNFGVTDIDATDIRCTNGRSAVLFQPHAIRSHNRIRIRDITATGCGFAIDVRNGFLDENSVAAGPAFSRPGIFRNVMISDVTVNYGSGENAQVRPRFFRLIPQNLLPTLPRLAAFARNFRFNGDTLETTPLGAVLDVANYDVRVVRNSVTVNGFPASLRGPLVTDDSTADRNTDGPALRMEFGDLFRRTRVRLGL